MWSSTATTEEEAMQVSEGMSQVVLTIGPGHTVREAAAAMTTKGVGAAVVLDPEAHGPGLLTERDVLRVIGRGLDPDVEVVASHLSANLTFAAPDWSLEQAAETMVRRGFRHLAVIDRGELAGIVSMRDIVRCWTTEGAACDVPAGVASD
jgi:CBS domain-containing protein